jgi:hypothetical protein
MDSFSEQGQDIFAFTHVAKDKGTFLDVGCYDPIKNNNTFGLEQQGWTGFLFDIDERWEDPCKKLRKNPFILGNVLDVNWKYLQDDFQTSSYFDYLSLDVDDHDHEPFSKTLTVLHHIVDAGLSFRAITVEHDAYRLGNEPRASIRKLLAEYGYALFRDNVSCRPPDPNWAFEDWFLGEEK